MSVTQFHYTLQWRSYAVYIYIMKACGSMTWARDFFLAPPYIKKFLGCPAHSLVTRLCSPSSIIYSVFCFTIFCKWSSSYTWHGWMLWSLCCSSADDVILPSMPMSSYVSVILYSWILSTHYTFHYLYIKNGFHDIKKLDRSSFLHLQLTCMDIHEPLTGLWTR
jgi:hypothetical protein